MTIALVVILAHAAIVFVPATIYIVRASLRRRVYARAGRAFTHYENMMSGPDQWPDRLPDPVLPRTAPCALGCACDICDQKRREIFR